MSALLAGAGLAACVPSAPLPVRGLVIVVTGGAGLLNDLDHPGATAARSLGLLTKVIAKGIDRASLLIYHATRTPADVVDRRSGHRTWTHTVPFCAIAAALVGLLVVLTPVAAAVSCGLLGGLLACGLRRAGGLLALATGGLTWWTVSQDLGWSWLLPLSVFVGCLVHCLGDWLTDAGVPILWPLVSQGKRWRLLRSPRPFRAGDHIELSLVRPLLWTGLVLTVAAQTGLVSALLSALTATSS